MIPALNAVVTSTYDDRFVGDKTTVTQHVVTLVPFNSGIEAHYFCALMNSSFASWVGASSSTGKSYGTPSILAHIAIPKFDDTDPTHLKLAELSELAHRLIMDSEKSADRMGAIQLAIDEQAAQLWGLSEEEFGGLRNAMEGTGFSRSKRKKSAK
jgi:hypothetical protein